MQKIYRAFFKLVTPFVKWFGSFHLPFTHKQIDGKFYYKNRDVITPGTGLLTTTYGEFSNLINPVAIKHAGIYIGKLADGICYVVEAVGSGVVLTDLVTFMTTKDVIVAVEPKFLTAEDRALLPTEAQRLVGIPYDYLFEKGNKSLYCFECVVAIFKALRPELSFKQSEVIKNKFIYDHDTFLSDNKLFTVLFDSRIMDQ